LISCSSYRPTPFPFIFQTSPMRLPGLQPRRMSFSIFARLGGRWLWRIACLISIAPLLSSLRRGAARPFCRDLRARIGRLSRLSVETGVHAAFASHGLRGPKFRPHRERLCVVQISAGVVAGGVGITLHAVLLLTDSMWLSCQSAGSQPCAPAGSVQTTAPRRSIFWSVNCS